MTNFRSSSLGTKADRLGYTLIEVMVAAAIVAAGVAAAAILAMTMNSQQEASARLARAFNTQEQAARLYQLGLDPATITNILPAEPGVISLGFTGTTTSINLIGSTEIAVCELVYDAGSLMIADGSAAVRTNEVVVVRPSIR
jgi:prepilin-type N-terminal cleavage/methylation domain-containing protein